MAPLPKTFCVKTANLRAKMFDGRHDQARRETTALLREGFASRGFLFFVAELLEPQEREKGQPARPPARWLEIAERFQEEKDAGLSDKRAREKLAVEFSASESTIRRAWDIYETAVLEAMDVR